MLRFDFCIPIYEWNVTIVSVYDRNDEGLIRNLYKEFGIISSLNEELADFENIRQERCDGGECYTNTEERVALIVLYKWSDECCFQEVLNHEKRHLIDKIASIHGFADEKECCAYLDGYVSKVIFKNYHKIK